jgi:replicative DNA helicase Mcm
MEGKDEGDSTVEGKVVEDRFIDFYHTYYPAQLDELYVSYPKKRSLDLDVKNLERFDIELANELIEKPDTVIPKANAALARLNPDPNPKHPIHARFFGIDLQMPMIQDVGSEYIGKLLTLDCLVVKRAEITPKVDIGVFKCSFCATVTKVKLDNEMPPDICPQCKRRSLKQVNSESGFINLQRVAVQDPLEKLKGSTPTWQLEVWLEDDMVNTVIPGDRVDITGILRIRPRKSFKGKEEQKVLFTMFFYAISIQQKQKEFAELDINSEEEKQIREIATDPHVFDKISKSIAPSIYGYDEIKQALALQLFGGTPGKMLVDGGMIRNDMHVLLIGDPGSAKTRLLQAVAAIVPKGIYVSGKSTTAAGLTATAERDDFAEGGWTLKAGALVLGSGGMVSIDEFDKISEEDKSSLLEALESQTISVAKAGIVAKFSAKTSILAAANPKFGRFDRTMLLAEQFEIPPALLSRFDLIFPITDVIDEERDKQIAQHILIQHSAAGAKLSQMVDYQQVSASPIESSLLRKYVAYARKNVKPRLTTESAKRIESYYLELRRIGMKQGATPITPRQIEGLIRLAEASAKTRLSATIETRDAELGISLFEYMLTTLGVDKAGRKDIDILTTGISREKVDKITKLLGIITRLEQEEGGAKIVRIFQEAEKEGIDSTTAKRYIDELDKRGELYHPRPGVYERVKREEG